LIFFECRTLTNWSNILMHILNDTMPKFSIVLLQFILMLFTSTTWHGVSKLMTFSLMLVFVSSLKWTQFENSKFICVFLYMTITLFCVMNRWTSCILDWILYQSCWIQSTSTKHENQFTTQLRTEFKWCLIGTSNSLIYLDWFFCWNHW
jgi:hypothetical protein